jgi:subtilisin family serine protease
MKRFSVIVSLALVVMTLLGASVAGAQASSSYIVFSEGRMFTTSMASAQVSMAGGRVTSTINELGAVVVSSTSPQFADAGGPSGQITTQLAGGMSNQYAVTQWSLTALRAQEAWMNGRRGAGATVAVLDEGFYLNHPDLRNNFLTSLASSQVPGETVQWMFSSGFSHGTHVSGIIAAEDNFIGTVGIAPEAKIIPVKVLSEVVGSGQFSWVLNGMLYVANLRAARLSNVSIMNMSLGALWTVCDTSCLSTKRLFDRASAIVRSRGIAIFASSGNNGVNFDRFPRAMHLPSMAAGVIAVTATAPVGWATRPAADVRQPASYSNFGVRNADVASTGGARSLEGTPEGNQSCTFAGFTTRCWVFDMVVAPAEVSGGSHIYWWVNGTSMASPSAAGIAALLVGNRVYSAAAIESLVRTNAQRRLPINFFGSGFTRAYR